MLAQIPVIILPRRIQPEQAMAEIHDGLAGRWQVLFGYVVKIPILLLKQPGITHQFQMLRRVVVAATGRGGDFTDGPRFARAQFLEDFPAPLVADCNDRSLEVRHGCSGGGLWCF